MPVQDTVTVMMMTTPTGTALEPVEIPRYIGHVKLGEPLGTGASGVVLSGYDEYLNRRVAVKVLHRHRTGAGPADLLHYIEGVRAAAGVKHPSLVTVHSVESVAGVAVIVMEFVDGVSLRDVLDRVGSLDPPLALYVLRSVAAGVDALHAANVLHRDLKPANVMLDYAGNAFVCDLGLACSFAPEAFVAPSRVVCGSPLYMAPEAFDGLSSPQGDVYALAGMLYELLTGRPPFLASSMDEVKALHIAAPLPLHELEALALREELIETIARGLHKQRFLRFKTAGHLLRALGDSAEPAAAVDAQRRRLAKLVEGHRDDDPSRRRASPENAAAHTTFDLIAERARSKREQRGRPPA